MDSKNPSAPPPSYDEIESGFTAGFGPPHQAMPVPQQPPYGQYNEFTNPHQYPSRNPSPQPNIHYTVPGQGFQVPLQHQQIPLQQTIIVAPPPNFGPKEQFVICPSCGKHVKTRIVAENNVQTHSCALILFIMGCFLCSCLPYLMDSCKNKCHYCPECNAYLGRYVTYESRRY